MTTDSGTSALTFQDHALEPIHHAEGEIWVRGSQVASALGYTDARRGIAELYERNAAEFTPSMTAVVKLPTAGGMQDVRIFSLRGAHLLGMFARTDRAAAFRRWVLDVLDRQAAPSSPPLPPPAESPEALAALARVTSERDILRRLVGRRLLKDNPQYHRVIRYFNTPGLTMAERARLMGWKTSTRYYVALHELAACGLIDWAPDPQRQAIGREQVKRLQAAHKAGTIATGRKPGTGGSREQLDKARAARSAKLKGQR